MMQAISRGGSPRCGPRWTSGGAARSPTSTRSPPSRLGPQLDARLVDGAVTLGELELVAGAPDAASLLAERVRDRDPYDERARRLAIAAVLQAPGPVGSG